MSLDTVNLPLFPLFSVLFPGATLPLHIFEERYKEMINFCVERQSPFGVVLIKSGKEVGGVAKPYSVGTEAKITQVKKLEEGKMNVLAFGLSRFKIRKIIQETPYPVGEIQYWDDEISEEKNLRENSGKLAQLIRQYLQLVTMLASQPLPKIHLPKDPIKLSYLAAELLPVDLATKQELLEEALVWQRLKKEILLLKAEKQNLFQKNFKKLFSDN